MPAGYFASTDRVEICEFDCRRQQGTLRVQTGLRFVNLTVDASRVLCEYRQGWDLWIWLSMPAGYFASTDRVEICEFDCRRQQGTLRVQIGLRFVNLTVDASRVLCGYRQGWDLWIWLSMPAGYFASTDRVEICEFDCRRQQGTLRVQIGLRFVNLTVDASRVLCEYRQGWDLWFWLSMPAGYFVSTDRVEICEFDCRCQQGTLRVQTGLRCETGLRFVNLTVDASRVLCEYRQGWDLWIWLSMPAGYFASTDRVEICEFDCQSQQGTLRLQTGLRFVNLTVDASRVLCEYRQGWDLWIWLSMPAGYFVSTDRVEICEFDCRSQHGTLWVQTGLRFVNLTVDASRILCEYRQGWELSTRPWPYYPSVWMDGLSSVIGAREDERLMGVTCSGGVWSEGEESKSGLGSSPLLGEYSCLYLRFS